jgi:hypothetical protein
MGLLTKIRSERPEPAAAPATAVVEPVIACTADPADQSQPSPTSTLPPAIPCLICDCPAIWISIYDRADPTALVDPSCWKCCDCDPPPAWPLVGARLMLVDDPDSAGDRWEVFGRGPPPAPSRGRAPMPTTLADPTDPTDPYRGPQPSWHRWAAFSNGGRTSRSNRPGRVTPQPPAQILAAPPIRCPRCQRGRVLRELRVITGGVCWGCHAGTVDNQLRNEIDEL